MKKFDFHTHCFPDKIAKTAMEKLTLGFGSDPFHKGTFDELKRFEKECGIDGFAIQNIATNARQMQNVNDFAVSCINEEENIFPFGSVFPDAPDALDELERIKSLGLRGVKFHSEYQSFEIDDPKMFPIYRKISELGLVVLLHCGADPVFKPPFKCVPEKIVNAMKHLDTTVICAHWGSVLMYDDVIKYMMDLDAYFDTSHAYGYITKKQASTIIEKHGIDKIVFASDSPWHNPLGEIELIDSLGLSGNEKEKLYWNNAKGILNLR